MTTPRPLYVGIDLGTTNSVAAVFDGERVDLVRNAQGATLTPSVVRIDGRGSVTVGARAKRFLDGDPDNVRTEWKRLMGTRHVLSFPASRLEKKPEELAAEVLRAIREDVRAQVGFLPERAVISVPALFELPQTAATSEAARLAGFERVEMLQEPVASAIGAGWKASDGDGSWLVYDLGGGTFDVSLLETREGLLRVVGHDGDNFLGGRDFDGKVVDWAIERIEAEYGAKLQRQDPAHLVSLRRLRAAAEEAKIELTRAEETEIAVAGLAGPTSVMDVSLLLDRPTLARLTEPLVMRSIGICQRLLAAHGLLGPGAISRIVLVGGPTVMPMLRTRITEMLGAPFSEGLDPMTLVAEGAALYAASAGLDARPAPAAQVLGNDVARVFLQYPALSPDLSPYIVGKLTDSADRERIAKIVVRRADGGWTSAAEPLDAAGTFAVMVSLSPRKSNTMKLEGRAAEGDVPIPIHPSEVTIVHGISVGDPPLSRSIGVALANNVVQVFFERGSPLPMRRTFVLRTVEALSPEDPEGALRVPIVQGEFPLAHLCRLVGAIEIRARDLPSTLPADAAIEVTIELDRGGRMAATARIEGSAQSFDQVVQLIAGHVPLEELGPRLIELGRRVGDVRKRAFRHGASGVVAKVAPAEAMMAGGARDEESARGGDLDAGEKVRRLLVDLDALVADAESDLAWPDLDERIRSHIARTTGGLAEFGTPDERTALTTTIAEVDKARTARNTRDISRHLQVIVQLGQAAAMRRPGAWESALNFCAGHLTAAKDPRRAASLIAAGRAAIERRDPAALEIAVRHLWELLPEDPEVRERGHGSGVR